MILRRFLKSVLIRLTWLKLLATYTLECGIIMVFTKNSAKVENFGSLSFPIQNFSISNSVSSKLSFNSSSVNLAKFLIF